MFKKSSFAQIVQYCRGHNLCQGCGIETKDPPMPSLYSRSHNLGQGCDQGSRDPPILNFLFSGATIWVKDVAKFFKCPNPCSWMCLLGATVWAEALDNVHIQLIVYSRIHKVGQECGQGSQWPGTKQVCCRHLEVQPLRLWYYLWERSKVSNKNCKRIFSIL